MNQRQRNKKTLPLTSFEASSLAWGGLNETDAFKLLPLQQQTFI